ncbi:low molecular weight phosphotyrosine protein phosphatase [Kaistella flava (ex Peng et al. 2021)]|uniref:protein-tyrosine-phosphatase n=1 Tax=Kaistella flava (ex Peng et al. 2021) TaxID=2038776 RepID=A0A7M2Y410_9FLAO|nr:low molecular weight protein-tyrosine-phosphatase [Kaistella flava (ex Peng et al. 2021)]QOW08840.1 low molecular weight phosphotyrosine protein phosphatase [Kaistella flava (ex Peng et al. 2021)]
MKILMVCLGNICRSPLAEGILQSKLPDNFIVDSAGTIDMHEGKNPDHRSIKTGQQYNVDISKQKSRHFTAQDFEEFDHIYCMDQNNLKDVLSLAKNDTQRNKVSLILENNEEVPDPYWGGMNDFDHVYQLLDQACERIAIELKSQLKEPSKK